MNRGSEMGWSGKYENTQGEKKCYDSERQREANFTRRIAKVTNILAPSENILIMFPDRFMV